MSETATPSPMCAAGRYHVAPSNLVLVLDRAGEILLNASAGRVAGRLAHFDTVQRSRWGGIISGDQVEVDFSACPCGTRGITVLGTTRYRDLPEGDDKLSCAGTIDAYVRGMIEV
jgi:hypothetical protein